MHRLKSEPGTLGFCNKSDLFSDSCGHDGRLQVTRKLKYAARNSSASKTQTNIYLRNARAAVSDQSPLNPPYVIGPPLNNCSPLTFSAFIQLQQTEDLFGMRGDVADMLVSLCNQPNFLKASGAKAASAAEKGHWKRLLSEHVRRSYRRPPRHPVLDVYRQGNLGRV